MDRDGFSLRAARDAARWGVVVLGGGAFAAAAWGQAPAPPEPPSAPSERVKRDAEKPYQWILLQSDKPRKARDGAGAAAGTAPAAAAPPRTPRLAAPLPKPPVAADALAPAAQGQAPQAQPAPVTPAPTSGAAAPAAPSAPLLHLPDSPAPDAQADEVLELVQQVPPSFPRAVMVELRKGSVEVRFKVQVDGTVVEPSVLKSTHPRLNKPVLTAVGQWKFKPVRDAREAAVELGFDLD